MQFLENLSDRQAASSVRARIELKLGKQATGYKTAQKVINQFIAELIGSV
jgi:hypothetical protein